MKKRKRGERRKKEKINEPWGKARMIW